MINTSTSNKLTNVTFFALFVFMFLTSSTVFGQEKKETVSAEVATTTIIASSNETIATTTTEFAIWFVGSVNKAFQSKSSTLSFGRKQLINSGINANKVLIKTVLKKVVGQETGIA
jgi:hypothetical protein